MTYQAWPSAEEQKLAQTELKNFICGSKTLQGPVFIPQKARGDKEVNKLWSMSLKLTTTFTKGIHPCLVYSKPAHLYTARELTFYGTIIKSNTFSTVASSVTVIVHFFLSSCKKKKTTYFSSFQSQIFDLQWSSFSFPPAHLSGLSPWNRPGSRFLQVNGRSCSNTAPRLSGGWKLFQRRVMKPKWGQSVKCRMAMDPELYFVSNTTSDEHHVPFSSSS